MPTHGESRNPPARRRWEGAIAALVVGKPSCFITAPCLVVAWTNRPPICLPLKTGESSFFSRDRIFSQYRGLRHFHYTDGPRVLFRLADFRSRWLRLAEPRHDFIPENRPAGE